MAMNLGNHPLTYAMPSRMYWHFAAGRFLFERHEEADAGSANRDATVVRRGRNGVEFVRIENTVDSVFISAFLNYSSLPPRASEVKPPELR